MLETVRRYCEIKYQIVKVTGRTGVNKRVKCDGGSILGNECDPVKFLSQCFASTLVSVLFPF